MSSYLYRFVEYKDKEDGKWKMANWYLPYKKSTISHYDEEQKKWISEEKQPDIEVNGTKLDRHWYWCHSASFGGDFISGRWSEYDNPWSGRGIPEDASEELRKEIEEDLYSHTYCTLEELWETYINIRNLWWGKVIETLNKKYDITTQKKLDIILKYFLDKDEKPIKDILGLTQKDNEKEEETTDDDYEYIQEHIKYLKDEGTDEIDLLYGDYRAADYIFEGLMNYSGENIRIIYAIA